MLVRHVSGTHVSWTVLRFHQLRGIGIVDVAGDAAILDARDGLVDDEQRNEKPLLGLHGVAEAVVDGDVQPRGREQPVEQVFHPGAVDARELVGRHHFDLRQQVGRFVLGVGDARLHPAAGHAHLVDDVAVLRDIGMIGQGAQDVDRAAFDIVGIKFAAEGELPALGRGQPPRGGVVVERALERAQQQIALGAVGEDEAQAAVHFPGGGFQRLADLGDVERDAVENEKVPGLNRAAACLRWAGTGASRS